MKFFKMMTMGLFFNLTLSVNAAEFCISSASALRTALATAESNNEDDVIKIRAGFFTTNGSTFSYDAVGNWDLEISGGWAPIINNSCGIQPGSVTILDGQTVVRVMEITVSGDANVTVSDLTFVNGLANFFGAGLEINRVGDNLGSGAVTVERSVFLNNESVSASSALHIRGSRVTEVQNNLFAANRTGGLHTVTIGQIDAYGIYFINNTVISNVAESKLVAGAGGDVAGVYLLASGTSKILVANNVLLDNGVQDLLVSGESDFYFIHNNVGVTNGMAPVVSFGNFNLPPRFESGLLDFTPTATSPLVNAGISPCFVCPIDPPFDQTWQLGDVDLGGNDRVQNGRPDIGAYESPHIGDLIFWDIFGG